MTPNFKKFLPSLILMCLLSGCATFQSIKIFNDPLGIVTRITRISTTYDQKRREFSYDEGRINENTVSLEPNEMREPSDYDQNGRDLLYTEVETREGSSSDLLAETTDWDRNDYNQEYQEEQGVSGTVPEIGRDQGICLYKATMNVNCREGDSIDYPVSAILMQGEEATLLSINPELSHGKFELINAKQCWIPLGLMNGSIDPMANCSLTIENPLPPRVIPQDKPDQKKCSSDLGENACLSAGGTWAGGGASAHYCECH
jgi:hypothetical protein